ncbi:Thioredoxin [Amphibacillus marinus]|uniref:Thioredoxin n=1 Tax=Amphibacillus marinus TaxID=872970 RepID=A0A1H8LKI4_9BACI|nr:thioredoxin domain-containing protein [Amphibacillus marinus]SEO05660.1 Thioredoxin [Amphibacillus marinus]
MDISRIKPEFVDGELGIKLGREQAPTKLIEFLNLRCPYCRQWFDESNGLLQPLTENGSLLRVIKLFNKNKESLQSGNLMHRYVPSASEQAYQVIEKLFNSQTDWGNLSLTEVSNFAEDELGLKQVENAGMLERIGTEAQAANIETVPTIMVGEHIFDQHISNKQLKQIIS